MTKFQEFDFRNKAYSYILGIQKVYFNSSRTTLEKEIDVLLPVYTLPPSLNIA